MFFRYSKDRGLTGHGLTEKDMRHQNLFLTLCACCVLLLSVAATQTPADASTADYQAPVVCEIKGTVSGVRDVARPTVPSPFGVKETHILVTIQDRMPRYHPTATDAPCPHSKNAAETRTYKLCSPTAVKAGDSVRGTEGTHTGPATPVGCLFDLVVMSQAL